MWAASALMFASACALIACGRIQDSGSSSTASAVATSPQVTPSSIPPNWQTYSDAEYAFKIAYPPGFIFKREGAADPSSGWLAEYRAVDKTYLNVYPPGQVELAIYSNDADTLPNWITKHTGASSSTDHSRYWQSTSSIQATSAAGRSAIAFDVNVAGFPATGHSTAFMQNSSRIVVVNWWSDASYASSVGEFARQMLATFDG
jgi:hypothetical protein